MMTLTAADITARIARNVRRGREHVGLSKGQLGVRMDPPVRHNEISRWERGLHRPSEIKLLQLAEILGQDPAWFYADHDDDGAAP